MCGLLGLVALRGGTPSLDDAEVERLRDAMAARGPDASGAWRRENAVLAHRRLAVRDPRAAADQPLLSADGRWALVYNGELYNDGELRRALEREGRPADGWRTQCDTETVLEAWAAWGEHALPRMRGMFALAIYDTREHRLVLARDPLGMKPLYFRFDERELMFASAIPPLLAHPRATKAPNLRMVSAYLSTIRTVLGIDTLFEGVYALEPGRVLRCDLHADVVSPELENFDRPVPVRADSVTPDEAAEEIGAALDDSVRRHLRADVPVSVMLSGGLDSALIAALARREAGPLRSYCAGAADDPARAERGDLGFGRRTARALDSPHAEERVTREDFLGSWEDLVDALGVPLSTPNEVAIHRVARRLRADGCVVTLSGEGADELLAGYEGPMDALHRLCAQRPDDPRGGEFQLATTAWVPSAHKSELLSRFAWEALEDDRFLFDEYARQFARSREEAGPHAEPIDAHARFLRRVNLAGLLQRLDTATMLASVEARSPFADVEVLRVAESLPMAVKYEPAAALVGAGGPDATLVRGPRTKRCLRDAARGLVPEEVRSRPKASFPLPFQRWIGGEGARLVASPFAQALFAGPALEAVAADPMRRWNAAWPMLNLARWGDRWFS